jgi:oligoendopeptidase F
MAQKTQIPARSELDPQYTWATEDLYPSDEAWKSEFEKTKLFLEEIASYKGKLGESAENLYEYLKLSDKVNMLLDSLGHYAARKHDEDTKVSVYQDMYGKFYSLAVEVQSASSFETPELLQISDAQLESFYTAKPELTLYKKYLDEIRRKREHILSPEEEKIIALAGEMNLAPANIYDIFSDADLQFPDAIDKNGTPHQVTQGSFISLMESEDRVLRKSAFQSLYHTYGTFKNTMATVLNSQVKQLIFNAKARKYDSTLQASLDETNVPVEVYHNLIDAVHSNFSYMHKYVRLRKKLLKLDELHMYDLYTPMIKDVDIAITYEEAKKTVMEAVKPLGEEYQQILQKGFNNRWIDVYENVGKRSGAYSAGARVHPFVLLNHKDNLNSEFTLAHEMGHAIHSYFSNREQPYVYTKYKIFVAEVASTCNEALLMEYLLNKTEDKYQRAYLINYFLEQFRTTLYRQTMFAEFELLINKTVEEGESLTAERVCSLYRDLNIQYYGEDIVMDSEIDLEWARIPHFYYNYYVFQYATGYSAAIALSRKILAEGEPAVKDYLRFLGGGCSKDPVSLLKDAGVDMTTAKPVNDALALFNRLIDELDTLLS